MKQRILGLTLAAALAVSAMAAPERTRIRGTVSAVSADTLAIHTAAGEDLSLTLGDGTKYLQVVPSSLAAIEPDSYIGTATKTVGSELVALEVVVFPAAMKGAGDGHYAWDAIPDTTVPGAGNSTISMMTNGSVMVVTQPVVESTMTNGNVAAASAKDGAKQLTVTYKDGQQTILVPPTAPIVTFQAGSASDLKTGASVFVVALKDEGKLTASTVAVGMNGLKPPM